ncbi:hypothetical protein [Jeotgalicoccus halotolerans]|uniref:Cyanophycin synthetase n=1 Tax=Jeotgalicoccus halotolerans TaxID=157227 RepID=A0A3E0B3U8_9STAP|nr:hypothetical protein [Jeotgalicoccus halotolerans]REG25872.1 cyanophycin synthetase [Jeotgalicoccus halotolerans]
MDVNDLNYLLDQFKDVSKNKYKSVNVGSNSSYITYLKRSGFNHSIETINASKKLISILTKEGKLIDAFHYPLYPNGTEFALNLTRDKFRAENHLHKCGLNTTKSRVYSYDEVEKAKSEYFIDDINERVVIKPLKSSLGRGVFVNVSKERFNENWKLSKEDLTVTELRHGNDLRFIVQNFLKGFEVRATILQGTLVALIARIPPYVEGNGRNTIQELIVIKNRTRKSCGYLKKYPINITSKIKEFLKSNNLSLDYIPKKNERVLLSSVSNIAGGGELINITDKVSDNIKEFALDVLASIPGLYSGGLDLVLRSFDDPEPHVIEINTFPVISLTKYPTYGKPSNPAKVLVESVIAQHQINNNEDNQYYIENADEYLKNFIDFSKRQLKFIDIAK